MASSVLTGSQTSFLLARSPGDLLLFLALLIMLGGGTAVFLLKEELGLLGGMGEVWDGVVKAKAGDDGHS